MHVLRSVLEVPLSIVLIHRGVDGDGLCVGWTMIDDTVDDGDR